MMGFIKDSWLNFYGSETFSDVRRMDKWQVYYQCLNFAMIFSWYLMVWKGLFVLSGTGKFQKRNKSCLETSEMIFYHRISDRCCIDRINGTSGDVLFLYHDRNVRELIQVFFVFEDTSGTDHFIYSS